MEDAKLCNKLYNTKLSNNIFENEFSPKNLSELHRISSKMFSDIKEEYLRGISELHETDLKEILEFENRLNSLQNKTNEIANNIKND